MLWLYFPHPVELLHLHHHPVLLPGEVSHVSHRGVLDKRVPHYAGQGDGGPGVVELGGQGVF